VLFRELKKRYLPVGKDVGNLFFGKRKETLQRSVLLDNFGYL